MSPVEDPIPPPTGDRTGRPPRVDLRTARILAGIALILGCGVLLLFTYGYATMATDHTLEPSAYWSEVWGKMLGLAYGGKIAWPASVGLLFGVALVVRGMSGRDQPGSKMG